MFTFDQPALRQEPDRLPPRARVAFAASCAQRLAGVYRRYLAEHGQADRAADCDRALDFVWNHIQVLPAAAAAQTLYAEIVALVPDQDAPGWTPLTAYGEDALSSLAYSLSCLHTEDAQEAAWAAERVYDALDSFVTSSDHRTQRNAISADQVPADPRIQAELARQARDLDELGRQGDALSNEFLNHLRQRSTREPAMIVE